MYLLTFSERNIMSPSDVTTATKPSRDFKYRLSIWVSFCDRVCWTVQPGTKRNRHCQIYIFVIKVWQIWSTVGNGGSIPHSLIPSFPVSLHCTVWRKIYIKGPQNYRQMVSFGLQLLIGYRQMHVITHKQKQKQTQVLLFKSCWPFSMTKKAKKSDPPQKTWASGDIWVT